MKFLPSFCARIQRWHNVVVSALGLAEQVGRFLSLLIFFICLSFSDTVLTLDVFKKGSLFASCAKVRLKERTKNYILYVTKSCYPPFIRSAVTFVCCICRTGQCVCGIWTVTVVRCDVWPRAPATPTLWAPSPAPGNTPPASRLISWFSLHTWLHRYKLKGEMTVCASALVFVLVPRMKASFVATGSQDCTVKVWDLPADCSAEGGIHQLTARATEKAHDKVQGRTFWSQSKKILSILSSTLTLQDRFTVTV